MENLKNYRVSLKFSEKDSEQVEVVKLLKQMGRKKSSFITKAVKYYMENNPEPEIPGNNNAISHIMTENIIKSTILKMLKSGELTYPVDIKENKDTEPLAESDYIEKVEPQKVPKKMPEKVERNIKEPTEDISFGDDALDMLEDALSGLD